MNTIDTPLHVQWKNLLEKLREVIGKKPGDLNGVLFLIGVQELGKGAAHFTKEQKQDLMHIGICRVLSLSGYYEFRGKDADGWPHWDLVQPLPHGEILAQESLLKMHVLEYFKENGLV
ncbi:hypothetical protein [Persicitalea jodogahamensis]|uniref:Uncharacterized protein n=1 Tax=Persicitalea jodogahamensis TaxID=402147 RepID=A0A8J3GCP2_9BACT|nr:hypothetical protein [Persicitalea jodogahamensis]GHB85890.1 hypothetical protein GCM10007390_46810 [Persicitalea jodogahamensis]